MDQSSSESGGSVPIASDRHFHDVRSCLEQNLRFLTCRLCVDSPARIGHCLHGYRHHNGTARQGAPPGGWLNWSPKIGLAK